MVIVDVNVLLYAVDEESADHESARTWLDRSLGGAQTVGLPWIVLLGFIRISTNPAIMASPMTADEAMAQVQAWLAAPAAVVPTPTSRHADLLRGLLSDAGTAGNLTTDAHLAALAVEHGAEIVSYDRDFARFTGVRHRLPE